MGTTTVYDFEAQQIDGKTVPLDKFKGKVLLIVNTASACGFTPQLKGLQQLHDTYGREGLVVLGFPCNQFGAQDPGSNQEIAQFCELNYGVDFPMMAKVEVNGPGAHPLRRADHCQWPGISAKHRLAEGVAGRYVPATREFELWLRD